MSMCIVASGSAIGSLSGGAAETSSETVSAPVDSTHPELAQQTIQGGAVLHCFCWSYNEIKTKLPEIKAAGYSAIQTSPVQPPTNYNTSWTDTQNQWWKLYQPLDLAVTNGSTYNSWLGTKEQLTSMCAEAENYGIKVIVDIVANHVANNKDNSGTFEHIHDDVAERLRKEEYYHDIATRKPNGSTDRYENTHYHIGMPDLNTENTDVQNMVIGLCEECIDCGVDGFRFDTAKAIEVPNDPVGTRSNFWPRVTSAIRAKKSDAFIYGEVLGNCCTTALSDYTDYMKLTDDSVGYNALSAVSAGSSRLLAEANKYYTAKANDGVRMKAEDSILWAESHDTYMNGGGSSQGATNAQIVKTWAIVGARNQSTSLFFARPNATMGLAGTDTTWKSTPVAEVNKFKNLFDGKSEYISYDSTSAVTLLERGKKGAVISKITDGSSISIPVHQMVDGEYTDHVTGNKFTVSNGVLTGTIDGSGVAVIYNANDIEDPVITASKLYLSPTPGWTLASNRDYVMYLFNGDGDFQWVSMQAVQGHDGVFAGDVPTGQWTGVVFVRKDSALQPGWNNNSVKNQTVDLFPSGNKDFFTVSQAGSGEKNEGTWSVYGATVDDTPDSVTNSKLYLDYSDVSWWADDNVRAAAYFFNSSSTNEWANMVSVDTTNKYFEFQIPNGNWTNVIFTRMNPAHQENEWNTKEDKTHVWNQTVDIELLPVAEDKNCYKLKNEQDDGKQKGSWEKYHTTHTYTPTWSWSSDNSTATLTLSCTCGRTLTFEKSVEPVSDDDKNVYTASVRYQGTVYSDTQTVYKHPTFSGYKIVLNGIIGIYFYVDFHQFTPSSSVTFTKGETTSTATLTRAESGSSVYRAEFNVAPKEIGDPITATVTAGDKTVSNTYSVKQYLTRIIKNENGEAGTEKPDQLKALARSMLNYGAKAQLQFGYNTSDYELVDYGLESYTPATPDGSKLTYTASQFESYGLKFAGSSLLLNDTTTLRLFFSKTGNFNTAPTLTYNGQTLVQGTKGSYLTYDLTGIAAPDLWENKAVSLNGSSPVNFCVRNYVLNTYGKGGTLGNVVTALYDYYVKANAYFTS